MPLTHRTHGGVLAALLLSGCGPEPTWLISLLDASQDDCPDGGVRIASGFDDNRDQTLSADETHDAQVVCRRSAGADGEGVTPRLIELNFTDVPTCPSYGIEVKVGDDHNLDRTLDDDEVLFEGIVCDGRFTDPGPPGERGIPGADGLTTLVDVAAASADTCPQGGLVVYVGADDNGDGLLAAREVDDQRAVCHSLDGTFAGPEVYGRFDISSTADLAALTGVETVHGDVHIACESGALYDVSSLASLRVIDGSLTIARCPDMATLDGLQRLETVRDVFALSSLDLITDLSSLTRLATVGGRLELQHMHGLQSLTGLPTLTQLGVLAVDNNDNLASLDGLRTRSASILGLSLTSNPALTDLTALASIDTIGGDADISSNPTLIDLTGLQALTHVQGSLTLRHNEQLVELAGLEALHTIDGTLLLERNPRLGNLDALAPAFTQAGGIAILTHDTLSDISGLYGLQALQADTVVVRQNRCLANQAEADFLLATGTPSITWVANGTFAPCP